MKVLMLNGSSHKKGTTYTALTEMGETLEKEGISYEIVSLGADPIRDCIACGGCSEKGCIFSDDFVNEFIAKLKEADGLVIGSPVYYAHPSGRIQAFLDRVFYSSSKYFAFKPGVSVAVARRGGTSASLDVLNKYFGISNMPIAGSTYWNMVHGANGEDAKKDLEGMQTMRNAARNLAWMLKCFEAGKENGIPLPEIERSYRTNFIQE